MPDAVPLGGIGIACALAGAVAAVVLYRFPFAMAIGILVAPIVIGAIVWRPLLGVYAGLFAIPLEALHIRVGSLDSTLADLIFLLTAAVAFFPAIVLSHAWRTIAQPHVFFAGLLGVASLGYFYAADPDAIVKAVRNAAAFLVLSIFVSQLSRKDLVRLLFTLVVIGGVVGLIAVFTTGQQEALQGSADVTGRATASFSHPNVLGFFLTMVLGPTIAFMVDPNWRIRLVAAGVAAGIAAGLALSLSRSAMIGAAAVLLILLVSSKFRRIAIGAVVLGGIIVAINFGAISQSSELQLLESRLSTVSVSGAGQDPRIPIWREAPRIIGQNFVLGVGEGNFEYASLQHGLVDPFGNGWDHAHNLLLTVTAELGVLGLALFGGFLITTMQAGLEVMKGRGPVRRLMLGLVASLSGLFVTGLVEYPPRSQAILVVILLLVGIIVGLRRTEVGGDGEQAAATAGP